MPCASQTSACSGEIGREYVKKLIIIILHFACSLCRSFKTITGGQVSNSDWPLVSEEHPPHTHTHTYPHSLTPSQNDSESLRKYAAHSVNTGYI